MAYGGDFLRQLMEQRRQGGGNGFGAEMRGSLERRKKRRDQRQQRMGQFRGLRDYAAQNEYDPDEQSRQDYMGGFQDEMQDRSEEPAGMEYEPNQDLPAFEEPNEQGLSGMGGMGEMNNGGEDLPPQDRNPYSPTAGQGFNLNNMLRRKRREYF